MRRDPKDKVWKRGLRIIFAVEISNQTVMTFSEAKNIVGMSGVKIKSSSFRYSELYALVERAAALENGVLAIVVVDGTLNFSEINTLAAKGGRFVSFDLTGH